LFAGERRASIRAMARVELAVLGPLELRLGGTAVPIVGPKQRVVLAVLAANANRAVSTGSLVEALWGEEAPARAEHTLQQHVSAIRKQIAEVGAVDASTTILVTQRPGYVLRVDRVDVEDWDAASSEGFRALGEARWAGAVTAFDAALALWRGEPFEDVHDGGWVRAAAVRLGEQRLGVHEARIEALLAAGRASDVVPELEQLVARHPMRERLWGQLMLALYRCGRQADALAAYRSAREILVEALGLEPGAELQDLEAAILQQSPRLDARPSRTAEDLFATFQAGSRPEWGCIVLPDGQAVVLPPGRSLIGRDPSALVRLVDNRVSRSHASIVAGDDGCTLRDLGSSNGTTVNGEPTTERILADGDVIGIGGVALVFRRRG
jgi:DNA-binding SARP family transcriptional activator